MIIYTKIIRIVIGRVERRWLTLGYIEDIKGRGGEYGKAS
jgi:hypothetical protein